MSWEDTLKSGKGSWEDTLKSEAPIAVQEPVELDWSGAGQLPTTDVGPQYPPEKELPPAERTYLERLSSVGRKFGPQDTTATRASRMFFTAAEPAVDAALAVGRPIQYWNIKALQGLTFNAPDILTAAITKINPELTQGRTLEEATLEAAQYDPSKFSRTVGEIIEFLGRLRTAKAIGTKVGILGNVPKDIGILGRVAEAAKLGLISGTGREISKTTAEVIDPTRDYGSQGAVGPLKEAAWLAGFSLANSLVLSPALQKVAGTATGQKIIQASDRYLVGISRKFPRLLNKMRKAPSEKTLETLKKGYVKPVKDIETGIVRYMKADPAKLSGKEKALLNHAARSIDTYHKRLYQAYMRDPTPDIVYRGAKPKQLTGLTEKQISQIELADQRDIARMDVELGKIQRGAMAETPATRGIVAPEPPQEGITKPEPPAVAPEAVEGKVEPTAYERFYKRLGKRLQQEGIAEEIHEQLVESGAKVNPIHQKFWSEVYPTLSRANQKKFERMLDSAWHTTEDKTNWTPEQWQGLAQQMISETPSGELVESLAGGERGMVALEALVNQEYDKAGVPAPPIVAPEALIKPPAKEARIQPKKEVPIIEPEKAIEKEKPHLEPKRPESIKIPEVLQPLAEKAKKTKTSQTFTRRTKLSKEEVLAMKAAGFVKKETRGKLPDLRAFWREVHKGKALEVKPVAKGMKPGFVDVSAFAEIPKTFMRILEPSKAVERKLGKEAYAAVIKGIHATDAARVEFEQSELPKKDKVFNELEEYLDRFPDKDLDNVMLSRGDPVGFEAQLVKRDAIKKLPKELRSPKLLGAIQHIADVNYKYLQSVVGDDVNRVADYFYGIYKNRKMVDKFLDYWRTTKRFTKEKKLPTYADAKSYGLQIKDPNPVRNLKSEYVAIAHLEGMNWLKDELLRTGKGKFIDDFIEAPVEWDKVQDPTFSGLRVQPDLAKLINNLIADNKITKIPVANALREINNNLRTVKFIGSAFHLLSVAKQSIADSGYFGFYKKTARRGFTTGFRKNDPLFKTPQYRDYIKHGGGHRYSVESESRKAFNKIVAQLNKEMGKAVKYGALPLRIPLTFVNWMFNSYIPKVKYSKFLDVVGEKEKKLGKPLKSSEKIDIIKEQQNFYGMMNERLFGRSGTVTTALRFYFLSPGYAEGNYRTMIKATTQWGGKKGYKASRSRSNIVNSLILTGTLATLGTMILTGKPPKKPETVEDLRDLFKIDTGKTDDKGRSIMIDLMTYDKDYWQGVFNVLKGRPDEAVRRAVKRIGGMKAPTADMIVDLALISMGRAVYDWKGDRVTEVTDPFLRKVMKLAVHEVRKTVPISVGVYGQARRREIDRTISAVETLLGFRPTMTEKDRRERLVTNRIYSLKGQQEKLYQYLGTLREPRKSVWRYNRTVNSILDSKMVPETMRTEWKPKLLIDIDRLLANKVYYLTSPNRTPEEIEKTKKYLKNFGIGPEQAEEYLKKYWERERKKVPISPLERDRVIGRARKRKRLRERMTE